MQSRLIPLFLSFLVCLITTSAVRGQVTFQVSPVTIPSGTNIVDGIEYPGGTPGSVLGNLNNYVCQDMEVDTDIDWSGAAMLVELSTGSMYQELEGFAATQNGYKMYNGQTSKVPSSAFYSSLPSSEYDTYVHGNGDDATLIGAGGDAGGDLQEFSTDEIDVSWYGPTGSTDDTDLVALGRFTFSNDAVGIWRLVVTLRGEASDIVVTGTIANGVMAFD